MTFKDIIGQSFLKTKLIQDVDSGRVPHAQLFVGKRGVGGMPMAIAYADYLTNQQSDGLGDVNPLTHPNIHFVYPVTTSEKVKSKPISSNYINEWRAMASDNAAIRARAKEALVGADTHYSKLIQKAYEVIDEATTVANLGAKTAGIKLVMDLERTRIDMLQKAGLLENKEMAEEMVAIEERQQALIEILKDIASEHPEIRDEIMRRLSRATKPGETVTIVSE